MAKQKKMTTHKKVRQDGRPNGKSWKSHPKGFDLSRGRLVTVKQSEKGVAING